MKFPRTFSLRTLLLVFTLVPPAIMLVHRELDHRWQVNNKWCWVTVASYCQPHCYDFIDAALDKNAIPHGRESSTIIHPVRVPPYARARARRVLESDAETNGYDIDLVPLIKWSDDNDNETLERCEWRWNYMVGDFDTADANDDGHVTGEEMERHLMRSPSWRKRPVAK